MKIVFDDKSYVMCYMSDEPGKVVIVISASDKADNLRKIINSVELTLEEFKKLISDVQV